MEIPRFYRIVIAFLAALVLLAGWALWQAYGLPVLLLSGFMLC